MNKPLSGIVVLDLTRVLAGPFCTMILSDLGAEVIKVEMPHKGDDSRYFGPFKNGKSLYFLSLNREKKSISLNLKKQEGKNILKELVKKSDVLVENFRPGTMEKLGLGYEVLKEINPRLIYAASSGFGHTGPDSKKPAYDMLVQAMGGIMSITGWENTPPTRVGMSIGDITASLFTAIGINAALYQREKTGKGQKIDVAMLDCQVAILENALTRYQVSNTIPKPMGNRHPTITPFQAFKAKDEYFVLPIGNDKLWQKLCAALDRLDLSQDPRFVTNSLRTQNSSALHDILTVALSKHTAKEWLALFVDQGIPAAPVNTVAGVFEDPQIKARKMLVHVQQPNAGDLIIAGSPVRMSSYKDRYYAPAPQCGKDTQIILKEI